MRGVAVAVVGGLVALCAAAPAHAAKACSEPGGSWQRATPAEAGMDAAKLQEAVDFGSQNAAWSVRVYRHGCLVAADRLGPANANSQFESWSLAKSVTSMVFGRAMTLGLVSPDDPIGALVGEADEAHGKVTMRQLLTMTSGLRWNGFRDYNIWMPDRIRDALTLEPVRPPGTWFEYAQSPVTLALEGVTRATGEDAVDFAQRELMDRLGIKASDWRWIRDGKGRAQGFFGVNMRPDDYGRLGDLMRRDGVWQGKRLLSKRYLRDALTPSPTNGCYGWLIWLNSGKPCASPRVANRPVNDRRNYPALPPDLYRFSGLFGQIVAVFPTQDVVVVRTGQDPDLINFAGGAGWESDLFEKVLLSITDTPYTRPPDADDAPGPSPEDPENDAGFQNSAFEPDQYGKAFAPDPLPAAGPLRARALRLRLAHPRAGRKGAVTLRVTCPALWPAWPQAGRCAGTATLTGARGPLAYDLAAGKSGLLRFRLGAERLRGLRRAKTVTTLEATAVTRDAAGGVAATVPLAVQPPTR